MYYNLTPSQLPTNVWMCVHILCVVCMCMAAPASSHHSSLTTHTSPHPTNEPLMKPPHHHNRTFQYPTHRQNAPKNKERTITHHHTPTIHSKIIISVPCFNMCFTYNAIYSRHHPLMCPGPWGDACGWFLHPSSGHIPSQQNTSYSSLFPVFMSFICAMLANSTNIAAIGFGLYLGQNKDIKL